MQINILHFGNDIEVKLVGLTRADTGAFVNGATVSVTLTDSTGAEVSGETWPLSMDYVAGSDGDYRAILEDGLPLVVGANYTATIIADAGADLIGRWDLPCSAEYRR